jgi:hypothetical protein
MALTQQTSDQWRLRWVDRVFRMTKAEIRGHQTAIAKDTQKLDGAADEKKRATLRSRIAKHKSTIKDIREWYGGQQLSAKQRWNLEIPDLP